MDNKRIKTAIIVAALCLISVAIVYAVATSIKNIKNTFTPSTVAIEIYENNEVKEDTSSIKLTSDGTNLKADKLVEIGNSSPNNGQEIFTRVCITPKFLNSQYSYNQIYIPHSDFPASISGNTYSYGDITFTLEPNWSDNWFYNEGYFYYKNAVKQGEKTEPLLSSISIPVDKWQDYKERGADLKVTVLADAIQSVGGAVENRWGEDIPLKSQDVARPDESVAANEISAFSINDSVASDSGVEEFKPVTITLTNYLYQSILDMATSVNVTTLYEYEEYEEYDNTVADQEAIEDVEAEITDNVNISEAE